MQIQRDSAQVKDLIHQAKRIVVIPALAAGVDGLCAGVALFKTLKNAGKNVSLIYPYQIPQGCEEFIKREEIKPVVAERSLVVNIDYAGTPIEKVNYFVEGDACRIVLTPVTKDFNTSKVTFSNTGFDYDLAVSIGAQKWEDHGALYKEYVDDIRKTLSINIDNSQRNENFGTINVVEHETEKLSQTMLHKLVSWGFRVDETVAKILLFSLTKSKASESSQP